MTEEHPIKIILIGESGVGKTNLIQVAIGNPFQNEFEPTISSSYHEGDITFNNKKYYYELWDTAGQEVYRSLNKMFIKESKIVLVVFAVNDRKSYEQINFWIKYAKESLEEHSFIMALVGNKSDLYMEQQIPDEEIKKMAEALNIKIKITSAMDDAVGFKKFMEQLIKDYITNIGLQLDYKKTFCLKSEKEEEIEEGNNNGIGTGNVKHKKNCC